MLDAQSFFRKHACLLESTRTIRSLSRLEARYDAIIGWNADRLAGARIVDMASHDGRWSIAAVAAGARSAVCVEARPELVESTRNNVRLAGLSPERFDIRCADAVAELAKLDGPFDILFCLGFYYHTMHHMQILMEARRLGCSMLLIDTGVIDVAEPVIHLFAEGIRDPRNTVDYVGTGQDTAIVGHLSRSALVLMMRSCGFAPEFRDWHSGRQDWTDLEDYRTFLRVTARGLRG